MTISTFLKVAFVSDTHSFHRRVNVPQCDILVHCGDATGSGRHDLAEANLLDFINWMAELPAKEKVFVPGNHDELIENQPELWVKRFQNRNIHLLMGTEDLYPGYAAQEPELFSRNINLMGLKIWGSPITPRFCNWPFMRDRNGPIANIWADIPEDTHLVVTHGPAYGILDTNMFGHLCGCEDLRNQLRFMSRNLLIHASGHIHEAYGLEEVGNTLFINASCADARYRISNQAVLVEVELGDDPMVRY
jgi:predicted phosphodiesterase